MKRLALLLALLAFPAHAQQVNVGPPPISAVNTWTPGDGSGASLVFTGVAAGWQQIGNMMFAYGTVTYPSTANAANATINGFPANFIAGNKGAHCFISNTNIATALRLAPQGSTATAIIENSGAAPITNATMSTGILIFECIYPVS